MSTNQTAAPAGRLGYAAFDADNHYYESTDALTRHFESGGALAFEQAEKEIAVVAGHARSEALRRVETSRGGGIADGCDSFVKSR